MNDSTEREQQQQQPPQRRPLGKPNWSAALAALDAQGAARDQAARDRAAQRNNMIRRTNALAAMSAEERAIFWEQEAQVAAELAAAPTRQQAQQAAQAQVDRLHRWREWLLDHPHTVDIHGNPRNHRADAPPEWFT